MEIELVNDFILFLCEQECVEEYFINLENAGKDPDTFFKMYDVANWVFSAFEWSIGPGTHEYWANKHIFWIKRLEDHGYTE